MVDVGCWFLIIPTDSRSTVILDRRSLSRPWYPEPFVIFIQATVYISSQSRGRKSKLYLLSFRFLAVVVVCSHPWVSCLAPLGCNVTYAKVMI